MEGQAVTVRVTVKTQPPAVGTPTGMVTVSSGVSSCSVELTPAGTGVCRLELTTAGVWTLTARYAGDANFLPSVVSVPHTVRPRERQRSVSVFGAAARRRRSPPDPVD